MLNLYRMIPRLWAPLPAGFHDLQHPPANNQPCLDVLRTLAISLVLLYHIQPFAPHAFRTLQSPVIRFGWTGVDLFFVLSGLLIGNQLWKELKARGNLDLRRFILRRGLRIWPLYYFVVALLLVQVVFFGRQGRGLWLDATFLSNYYFLFPAQGHQVGGGWSLSLEEQFYILIPVLLAICARLVSSRWLVNLPLIWLIALPLIREFATLGLHDPVAEQTRIFYPFYTHSDGLAVGLLIAWIITWKPEVLRFGRWLDVALVLVSLVSVGLWRIASPTFLFSLVAIGYGALTFFLLRVQSKSLFRSRYFYAVSRLSYGVYLLHPAVLNRMRTFHGHPFGEGFRAYVCAFALAGATSLALAFLTFSLIELPFLRLRDRFLAKRSAADSPDRSRLAGSESAQVEPLTILVSSAQTRFHVLGKR